LAFLGGQPPQAPQNTPPQLFEKIPFQNQLYCQILVKKELNMNANVAPKKPGKFPIAAVVIAIIAFGVIFSIGGFAFAASQEQHDSFCASCHTQPESTFYERSTAAQASDLASFHTAQKVNCIDCHSGAGLTGRLSAELLGARNAALWYTGTAKQPAVITSPISDQNCLKCHQDATQKGFTPKEQITIAGIRSGRGGEAGTGHWHTFMARWQAASATAGTCTSCHGGHVTGSTAQAGFMLQQPVQQQCDACHQVLRKEGGGD
jgi:hypothetical protein